MRRTGLLLVMLGLASAWSVPARAAGYSERLAQCLIGATTPAGRKVALRWAFATMSLDPDVASMASITSAQRESINRRAGDLVTSLLVNSCRQPVQQALMYEGPSAVESAFGSWGRWAITGVATEPHVARGMAALLQYLDMGKLMSLVPLQGFPPASGSSR